MFLYKYNEYVYIFCIESAYTMSARFNINHILNYKKKSYQTHALFSYFITASAFVTFHLYSNVKSNVLCGELFVEIYCTLFLRKEINSSKS